MAQALARDFFVTTAFLVILNFGALAFLAAHLTGNAANVSESLFSTEFLSALLFTLKQAFASAVCCVAAGLLVAPGYARAGKLRRMFRWVLILPNVMSPVLAVLCLLVTFKTFPFGFAGILIGHVFLNGGICAVWLGERWLELESKWGPLNQTIGGRTLHLWRKGIVPLMLPQIKNTFAVVFSLCLASFAIPLVLGGGPQNSTLEVLIYERLHVNADVTSAIVLGLIQCALQFAVFAAILKPSLLKTEYSRIVWTPRFFSLWILPLLAAVLLSLIPLAALLQTALPQLRLFGFSADPYFQQSVTLSMTVALGVALAVFVLLNVLTATGWKNAIVNAPTLSGVAVGTAWLVTFKIWNAGLSAALIAALIWGHLNVLFLPIFRLSAPSLSHLRERFEKVVTQLGATRELAFKKVYMRLGLKTCASGAILAACWSMSEFSVSRLMSSKTPTLPVYIQNLLSSYRLELASACAIVLLLLSILSMMIFEVLADGLG